MHIRNLLSILGLMLAVAILSPVLSADEANQATKVTFSQPVQVPGKTLPAGTYWMQLAQNSNSKGIVQIFNENHEFVVTLFTIPRERQEATGQSAFVFANRDDGKPEAIVAWFYPGRTDGHEFLYPKPERQELAREKTQTVVAGD
jgi:hypothetical protein